MTIHPRIAFIDDMVSNQYTYEWHVNYEKTPFDFLDVLADSLAWKLCNTPRYLLAVVMDNTEDALNFSKAIRSHIKIHATSSTRINLVAHDQDRTSIEFSRLGLRSSVFSYRVSPTVLRGRSWSDVVLFGHNRWEHEVREELLQSLFVSGDPKIIFID